jgi:hypothetical protein
MMRDLSLPLDHASMRIVVAFVDRSSGLDRLDHLPSSLLEKDPILDADVEKRHRVPTITTAPLTRQTKPPDRKRSHQ